MFLACFWTFACSHCSVCFLCCSIMESEQYRNLFLVCIISMNNVKHMIYVHSMLITSETACCLLESRLFVKMHFGLWANGNCAVLPWCTAIFNHRNINHRHMHSLVQKTIFFLCLPFCSCPRSKPNQGENGPGLQTGTLIQTTANKQTIGLKTPVGVLKCLWTWLAAPRLGRSVVIITAPFFWLT